MILSTNDGFIGLDGWKVPAEAGSYTIYLNGYDAGTEVSDEIIISVAMKKAHYMSRLIEPLFELAHLDSETIILATEPLGIAEFSQDVLQKMVLKASKKQVILDIEPKDPSMMVMANIEKLESVYQLA